MNISLLLNSENSPAPCASSFFTSASLPSASPPQRPVSPIDTPANIFSARYTSEHRASASQTLSYLLNCSEPSNQSTSFESPASSQTSRNTSYYSRSSSPSTPASSPRATSPNDNSSAPHSAKIHPSAFNVRINRKTTLSRLYEIHSENDSPEYPETSASGPVGYVHHQDLNAWFVPLNDTAYSWGDPMGTRRTTAEKTVTHPLLVDDLGQMVPCHGEHGTCQGIKICPFNVKDKNAPAHSSASPQDISRRLAAERSTRLAASGPTFEFFERTHAFVVSLQKLGCRSKRKSDAERPEDDALRVHHRFLQRGYVDKVDRCEGRIKFVVDFEGKPFLRCEHFDVGGDRSHYIQQIDECYYNVKYLEAFFTGDVDEAEGIEMVARTSGHGPLAECHYLANSSSRRRNCPFGHRHPDGTLKQPLMVRQKCGVKYQIFEPLEEYRERCPRIFVMFSGEHTHTPPFQLTTPQHIRADIIEILVSMREDLVDLTPRGLLRHASLRKYIQRKLPENPTATLADIHVSLANRAHLGTYIQQVKAELYPHGSAWKGALHLYQIEVDIYPTEARYIRNIIQLDVDGADQPLKIIVCMSPESSKRFKQARRIQSDVSYKRISGFQELVMGHWDTDAHTSLVFCRMYVNSESAEAHKIAFDEVERLVEMDTGSGLRWRHLDASSIGDLGGTIIQWTSDQGGGQAKGLGLHLQDQAQKRTAKYDLHEPHRLITELGPYDHLRRVFRLCTAHANRNIRQCDVPEGVRNDMRSLMCVRHNDWDGTIARICELGGKKAQDWVANKEGSKFAFSAMCWERSFIPLPVWQSGERNDNLIESSHFDVNQDGRHCSLVAGIEKGRRYDLMKLRSVKAIEDSNVRPSYKSGNPVENQERAVKRHQLGRSHKLEAEDKKIETYNANFNDLHRKWRKADQICRERWTKVHESATDAQRATSESLFEKSRVSLESERQRWISLENTVTALPKGSGRIRALTFTDVQFGETITPVELQGQAPAARRAAKARRIANPKNPRGHAKNAWIERHPSGTEDEFAAEWERGKHTDCH